MTETIIQRCCFSGHRPEKLKRPIQEITEDLEAEVIDAINDGFTVFLTGMAKGTDIIAGEIVLRLQDAGSPIQLVCAVPYPGFEKSWSSEWKQRYGFLLSKAEKIHYISTGFFRGCFQKRNRWLVDHSEKVIAVYNGFPGGTKNTIDYARRKGVKVIEIEG